MTEQKYIYLFVDMNGESRQLWRCVLRSLIFRLDVGDAVIDTQFYLLMFSTQMFFFRLLRSIAEYEWTQYWFIFK